MCVCVCVVALPFACFAVFEIKARARLRDGARRAVESSKGEPFMQEGLCGFDTLQPVCS